MSGRTPGVGPNLPGDDPALGLHPVADGDIGPQAPLSLCPTPQGKSAFNNIILKYTQYCTVYTVINSSGLWALLLFGS